MQSVLVRTDSLTQSISELRMGKYMLLRQLGHGGSATIYLAEQTSCKSHVALKLLNRWRADQQEVERFHFEARLLTQLQHRHIVPLVDCGWEQATPYLVMKYAPGETLQSAFPQGVLLPVRSILPTVLQLASALQYVHDHRVIHSDVKPENVLLGPGNRIWLADFGIATLVPSGLGKRGGKREVKGTARYMAPEQIQGKPVPASDQYALAVMVYEWLCGRPPFHGSVLGVQLGHVSTPPPALRDYVSSISPAVERVVLKALSKDPQRRFAQVMDFASALKQATARKQMRWYPSHCSESRPAQHISQGIPSATSNGASSQTEPWSLPADANTTHEYTTAA
jgi:eukaryotic-like serine/threonine-protein kinase